LTKPQNATAAGRLGGPLSNRATEGGEERTFTRVAALVDTNVLVSRFDNRFPNKQKVATEILRRGIRHYPMRLAHQQPR